MKTNIQNILVIIFFTGVFTGCSFLNEEDNFNGTMDARINDNLIIFDEAYGNRRLGEDLKWSGILYIVGMTKMDVSGYEIQIDFPLNPTKGITYHTSCMFRTWIGNYYDYKQTAYITKSTNSNNSEYTSTITFTSLENQRYKGTFSFTANLVTDNQHDSVVVTNGNFEIDSDGRKW
ncbi:MAG: hypothetical protein FD181_2734 [Prolixibacteraceae bacterium]|nr:MAG: hypothetical protein FD181_2734 [Prolixibacteraceae bacterium]